VIDLGGEAREGEEEAVMEQRNRIEREREFRSMEVFGKEPR